MKKAFILCGVLLILGLFVHAPAWAQVKKFSFDAGAHIGYVTGDTLNKDEDMVDSLDDDPAYGLMGVVNAQPVHGIENCIDPVAFTQTDLAVGKCR